ncbi:hypothetical protein CEUSTIGMA_g11308.t1 [Chlamydomonas eustigma]|uniref:Uncharacterized protein n=1 Tax=Chlamydomonas eustigma TaxID=1157962 RepID=A0A250XLI2_9CHLO|nr:hypothetical protein CEUSTIGMA_g11308.t1 [Chlamydomonas eustigma]|eukprot:GAX83883.1 hypothetical protein CEUSTIGMA_g11308.t1 [Chlamydomonas eustigma]
MFEFFKSREEKGVLTPWIKSAIENGLLLSKPHLDTQKQAICALPHHQCGVSLAFLEKILRHSYEHIGDDYTTHSFVENVIISSTSKGKKCRFIDLIPREHIGNPSNYIVHAWQAPFLGMLEQLLYHLAPRGFVPSRAKKGAGTSASPAWSGPHLFVWIDFIAVNQHTSTHLDKLLMTKDVMARSCPKGIVLVVDDQQFALTRMWCLYEVWCCLKEGGSNKVNVFFPINTLIEDLLLFEATCQKIDLTRSETSWPDDKQQILAEAKSSPGLKMLNEAVREVLVLNGRVAIRWSSAGLPTKALYCMFLLKISELSLLQLFLQGIPGIVDGDKALSEIIPLLKGYLENEQDQLKEPVFVEVMMNSGFSKAESQSMFWESSGGLPLLSLDAFKGWWRKGEGHAASRKPAVLTMEALRENLSKFVLLLRHNDHFTEASQLEGIVREAEERGQLMISSNKSLPPSSKALPPPALSGDWQTVSDEISYKLHFKDFRAAAVLMHTFLMSNSKLLPQNPFTMVKPSQSLTVKDLSQGLPLHLGLFCYVLRTQPNAQHHCDHYMKLSNLFRDPEAIEKMLSVHKNGKSGGGISGVSRRASTLQSDVERMQMFRNVISLKYKDFRPLSSELISEAETVLASMAAGGKVNADVNGKHTSLSSQYLDKAGKMASFLDVRGSMEALPSYHVNEIKGAEAAKEMRNAFRRSSVTTVAKKGQDEEESSVLERLGPDAAAFYALMNADQQQKLSMANDLEGIGIPSAPRQGRRRNSMTSDPTEISTFEEARSRLRRVSIAVSTHEGQEDSEMSLPSSERSVGGKNNQQGHLQGESSSFVPSARDLGSCIIPSRAGRLGSMTNKSSARFKLGVQQGTNTTRSSFSSEYEGEEGDFTIMRSAASRPTLGAYINNEPQAQLNRIIQHGRRASQTIPTEVTFALEPSPSISSIPSSQFLASEAKLNSPTIGNPFSGDAPQLQGGSRAMSMRPNPSPFRRLSMRNGSSSSASQLSTSMDSLLTSQQQH